MQYVGWIKVTAGHYRHPETGIEIARQAPRLVLGRRVGVRWNVYVPQPGSARSITYSGAATLTDAVEWATTGEDSFAARMRALIALAWDEAYAEHLQHEQLMREGEAIREANAREQVGAWWTRHELDQHETITAELVLAARDADHDEALRIAELSETEYAGAHHFRGELGDRCEYPDCSARVGSPVHVADQPRIDAAHHSAIMENQLRTTGPVGMGRR